MFTLDRKKIISSGLIASVILLGTACNASTSSDTSEKSKEYIASEVIKADNNYVFPAKKEKGIDGGSIYIQKDNMYTIYALTNQDKKDFHYGRTPSKTEEAAWDVDVMPDGTGLPEGSGSVEDGDELYEEKCAMCHGDFGSGGKGSRSTYPKLAGGDFESLKNQRTTDGADGPSRVIGSYWPYPSTLFWYIKTGMPFPHPKSLTNDEVYAITAYLLSINEIEIDGEELDDEYVLNREKFLKINMPNKDGFIPKIDGPKGPANVKAFLGDTKNYGNGTRCMTGCLDGKKPNIKRIASEIKDFEPPMSVERDFKEAETAGAVHPGQKTYESKCAVCHATDAMGAPVAGDKASWETRLKNGKDALYASGIKGINAMPPKGGAMDLSDDEFKAAVDFMIDSAK
jgi:cytochrome c